MVKRREIAVVDLFCGVGGISHGFVRQKMKVVAGVDIDESCKYAYERNNNAKFVQRSIEDLDAGSLLNMYPPESLKVLVGCAPCQPFSNYNREKKRNRDWKLLYEFSRLVASTTPDIVSMENVPQITRHKVFEDFTQTLIKCGYEVEWQIVNCQDYGVPQKRRRLVLLASRRGKIKLIPPTHLGRAINVKDAIGNLPDIVDGGQDIKDPLHVASKLSPLNKRRIRQTPEGGSWRDWDSKLISKCHRKRSGRTYGSVYGRMNWFEPAPTMTTLCIGFGNGRFGHPSQDRGISLREAAILQSFPRRYDFLEDKKTIPMRKIARQIGNAVPPRIGEVIALSIRNHLETHDGR